MEKSRLVYPKIPSKAHEVVVVRCCSLWDRNFLSSEGGEGVGNIGHANPEKQGIVYHHTYTPGPRYLVGN